MARVLRDSIQGITKPVILRLAKRGGVAKVSRLMYEEVRGILKIFLEIKLSKTVTVMEYRKRKTIITDDIKYAFNNNKIYGEVTSAKPCKIWEGKKSKDYLTQLQKEIKFYQNQPECLFIPQVAFEKLVREILQDFKADVRIQKEAILTLQYAVEYNLTKLFETAMLITTIAAKRLTMFPKDLQLARRIAGLQLDSDILRQ